MFRKYFESFPCGRDDCRGVVDGIREAILRTKGSAKVAFYPCNTCGGLHCASNGGSLLTAEGAVLPRDRGGVIA